MPNGQLVRNGGFETGDFSYWGSGGAVNPNVWSMGPDNNGNPIVHGGQYAAFLGDVRSNGDVRTFTGDSWIKQKITIPRGSSNVFIRAWMRTWTWDTGTTQYDWQEGKIIDLTDSSKTTTWFKECTTELYKQKTRQLDPEYVGHTIEIYFNVHDDGYVYVDSWGNVHEYPTAMAIDDVELTFDAEANPPVTTASVTGTLGSNGWYKGTVTVTLTATDTESGVNATFYRLNGGAWQLYDPRLKLTLNTDGQYYLEYYSDDCAGNVERPKQYPMNPIKIDMTAPSTTSTINPAPGPGGWYRTTVNVTLQGNDLTSGVDNVFYKLDAGSWTSRPSPALVQISGGGTHTLYYYSTDRAGNKESQQSLSVKIDSSAPTTIATTYPSAPNAFGWFRESVDITLTATDSTGGAGIERTYYRIDRGNWNTYTRPFTISDEKFHNVSYYSTDKAGNTEPVQTLPINIDLTAPTSTHTIEGTLGNDSKWFVSDVKVRLSGSDSTSKIESIRYSLDNAAFVPYTDVITITTDGRHTLQYYAVDRAGNEESPRHTVTINIDKTPPVTTITFAGGAKPNNNGWYNMLHLTINLSATDGKDGSGVSKIWYMLDSGAWQIYEKELLATEGIHIFRYYSVDIAGNTELEKNSSELKYDRTPPTIVHSRVEGATEGSSIVITATITDPGGNKASGLDTTGIKLYYRLKSSTNYKTLMMRSGAGNTYSATIPGEEVMTEGICYYIEAKDLAGNIATEPKTSAQTQPFDVAVGMNPLWFLLVIPVIVAVLIISLLLWRRKKKAEEGWLPFREMKLQELAEKRQQRWAGWTPMSGEQRRGW